jgi:hypothetical protein
MKFSHNANAFISSVYDISFQRGVAQLGSARDSGSRGRRFESFRPDPLYMATQKLTGR